MRKVLLLCVGMAVVIAGMLVAKERKNTYLLINRTSGPLIFQLDIKLFGGIPQLSSTRFFVTPGTAELAQIHGGAGLRALYHVGLLKKGEGSEAEKPVYDKYPQELSSNAVLTAYQDAKGAPWIEVTPEVHQGTRHHIKNTTNEPVKVLFSLLTTRPHELIKEAKDFLKRGRPSREVIVMPHESLSTLIQNACITDLTIYTLNTIPRDNGKHEYTEKNKIYQHDKKFYKSCEPKIIIIENRGSQSQPNYKIHW